MTYILQLKGPFKHPKCRPPSDIAVERDLERLDDARLDLKLVEFFDTNT